MSNILRTIFAISILSLFASLHPIAFELASWPSNFFIGVIASLAAFAGYIFSLVVERLTSARPGYLLGINFLFWAVMAIFLLNGFYSEIPPVWHRVFLWLIQIFTASILLVVVLCYLGRGMRPKQ